MIELPVAAGKQGTVSSSGTVTLVFGWTPPSWLPNQKPSGKTLSILASSEAIAQQWVGYKPLSIISLTLDDGFGDAKKSCIPTSPDDLKNGYISTSNNHLLSADISSATFISATPTQRAHWEVRVPLPRAQAQATVQSVDTVSDNMNLRVGGGGVVDSRSVKLTRNGKDTSNMVNGSWVTNGDTLYTYGSQTSGIGLTHTNSQPITASVSPIQGSGAWTLHYYGPYGGVTYYGKTQNWTYSGNAQAHDEKWQSTMLDAPMGNLILGALGWQGSPTGSQQEAVTYKITDDDGAQATAQYNLTFHDPVEQSSDTTSQVSIDVPIYNADGHPIYTSPTTGATKGNNYMESSVGYSNGIGWSATFDLSGWLKFLSIDVSNDVSYSHDINTGAILGVDVPPGSYAQAYATDTYTRHHRLLWNYDTDGLIPRRATVSLDPYSPVGEIIPDEAWNDVFQSSSVPFWKGPIYGPVPPNQADAPVPTLPKPSNSYS